MTPEKEKEATDSKKLNPFIKSRKLGFIGAGNMTTAVVSGLIHTGSVSPEKIYISSRSQDKVSRLSKDLKIIECHSSDQVLEQADVIFLAVKPQDLSDLLDNIGKSIDEHQIVISFAAGYGLKKIRDYIPRAQSIVRVMPNTASEIGRGILGYAFESEEAQQEHETLIREILGVIGVPLLASDENLFDALMIGCSSGIGFILEFMQIWAEWLEEKGFSSEESALMTTETFLATALLSQASQQSFEQLQNKVTSKKGVTAEGLESFRAMDLDRTLRIGFENALLRNLKLAR